MCLARRRPAMSMDERLHHLFARIPDVKVHLYGKEERPAARSGTSTSSARGWTLDDDAYVRCGTGHRAAHWLSHAEWTDGWDEHD